MPDKTSMNFILLLLFSFSVLAFDLGGQRANFYDVPEDILARIEERDETFNVEPLKLEKSVRLTTGAVLDESCLQVAKDENIPQDKFIRRFEKSLKVTAHNMLECEKSYPELRPYISEWVTSYRRHYFKCTNKDESSNYNTIFGTTYLTYNTMTALTSPRYIKSGAYHQTALGTLAHEILHTTSCNNRADHNDIENIQINNKNFCGNNISLDRVSVVEALCIDAQSFKGPITKLFVQQKEQCKKNTCERLFNGASSSIGIAYGIFRPAKDLSKDAAQKLCARIHDDGQCLIKRENNAKELWNKSSEIQGILAQIRERLKDYMPQIHDELPLGHLDYHPALKEDYRRIQASDCFKNQFEQTPHGIIPKSGNKSPMPYDDHFDQTMTSLHSRWMNSLKTCSVSDRRRISKFLNNIRAEEVRMTLAPHFRWIEGSEMLDQKDTRTEDAFRGKDEFEKILGQKLHQEFLKVMNNHHPQSANFDCVKEGLSPFRTMEKFLSLKAEDILICPTNDIQSLPK